MSDAQSANSLPPAPEAHAGDRAAPVLGAGERARSRADARRHPVVAGAPPRARNTIAHRQREPARRPRASAGSEPTVVPSSSPARGASRGAADGARPDTRAELRDWIKDNAALLSNASLLISLSAVALNLLPAIGIFSPYIKALLFAAALLLLIELHQQWPDDLQLYRLRKNARPANHSWRMTAFALMLQIATLIFVAWATLTNPIILLPLTALGIVVVFYRWYFCRYEGRLARSFGIVALVGVLLLAELLMVVVWATVTGEPVTLELWTEDRPGVQLHLGD